MHGTNVKINHDTHRTEFFGNMKNFNFVLLLLPLHPGKQHYWFRFIMDLHKFIIHLTLSSKYFQLIRQQHWENCTIIWF